MNCKSIIIRNFTVFFGIFFLQFILFFPLGFLGDFHLKATHFIFGDFTQFLLEHLLDKKNKRIDYSSDSWSMLALIIILLVTSATFILMIKKRWTKHFLLITEYVCVIYISLILIKYGIDKIFKTQFPEPESNILFTRFGNLDKDILFWSTIGTSKMYNIITGSIEILSGILLLFKRTQFLGLLFAMICFSQILMINISFDISVKFFSVILLLMNVFLLRKNGWKLILKIITLPKKTFLDKNSILPYKTFINIVVLGIVLVKIVMPYFIKEENKNSEQLTGVYEITSHESPYKYLFFHQDQYLIFMEKSSEKMASFHYYISFDNQIILEDYQHNISKHSFVRNDKYGTIVFSFNRQIIDAKPIHYQNMNALQDRFHVLVD